MDEYRLSKATGQILLGIIVQVLAISCWFATAAAVPSLSSDFRLSDAGRTLLVTAVQAGFAIGAIVVGLYRLSDRLNPQLLIPVGALVTAAITAMPLLAPNNFSLLVCSRFLVGVALAAIYPAGMRATVSWATPQWRGLAVAGMVGALALGTAAPHLLDPTPIEDWRVVLLTCAAAACGAAVLSIFIRPGPFVSIAHPGGIRLGNPLRHRRQQRITIAYVGHMWEVYGLWIWLPALLVTLLGMKEGTTGLLTFFIIGVVGALGCLASGALSSRYGKRSVARGSVLLSAVCALLTPLLPLIPLTAAIIILMVWSASALCDSPLFSALTGDASDPRQVGSAIALQMGIGYFLSIAGIMLVGEAANLIGWQFAFLVLALGPITSFIALRSASPESRVA